MINIIYEKSKKFIQENYKILLVFIIILLLFKIELPYKIYTPGGMVDLESRIIVDDGYKADGKLGLAYVSMLKGNIPFLLMSYIIPNWDIMKDEEITYENESVEETFEKDKILMQQSIDNATFVAYKKANKEINIKKEIPHITYIDSNAQTNLELLDVINFVEDTKINDLDDLRKIISNKKVGDKVNLKITRNNKDMDAYATVYNTSDGPKIGVSIVTTYEYDLNPKLDFKMKSSESGPSGGLMMSLAIYNSLVETDITKGKKIIGTGTIDEQGNIGEIGGVKYKLLGAEKEKCDIFLVPEKNYDEAIKVKEEKHLKITIIKVKTFDEALESLKAM